MPAGRPGEDADFPGHRERLGWAADEVFGAGRVGGGEDGPPGRQHRVGLVEVRRGAAGRQAGEKVN
jgi:hypothetical protein